MIYIPPKPPYEIRRTFFELARADVGNNDPFHRPNEDANNFGGQFLLTSSGTLTSTASVYFSPSYIPESGPVPEFELEKNHIAQTLEWVVNLKAYNEES